MTKVALEVDDNSMAPTFKKGDIVIVDVQAAVNAKLVISRIVEKKVIFAPIQATANPPVIGTLISTYRRF